MNYVLGRVTNDIEQSVARVLELDSVPRGIVEYANPKIGANLAVPCFTLAVKAKKSPVELAKLLADSVHSDTFERVEATGPYVNIWLSPAFVASAVSEDLSTLGKTPYGNWTASNPKTVIVEFPSPNMAKPFSIGHLRPAIQGWAMHKLIKATGHKVITDDHLGDSGTAFGKWVVGFLQHSSEERLDKDGIYELARVYIQITKDLKDEKEAGKHELADAVQAWLTKLEKGDPEAVAYRDKFSKISLEHIHHVYDRLGIHTDHAMGESGFVVPGKKLVEQFVKDGIAVKQDDGSVIIPLEGFETPMLVLKSNGTANYATTDIATLDYRMKHWHPDKIIHVVGAEQQFHFNQLFALAKKLGYTDTEFVHYWFGIIDQLNDDGTRSKMSSRKGVVLLEDLLDKAQEEAALHASPAIANDSESLRRIALGAVKFTDLGQDKKTNVLFDWQTMFNMQGYSCSYIQYAAVRIAGILGKFGSANFDQDSTYDWKSESELLLCIAKYPDVVREAAEAYEPHRVATYLYDLARTLNRYYENTPVGSAEPDTQKARLWMLGVVKDIFEHGLDLLGIQVPEKM